MSTACDVFRLRGNPFCRPWMASSGAAAAAPAGNKGLKGIIAGYSGLTKQIDLLTCPSVDIDTVPLPFVQSIKNLGSEVDSQMKWGQQVASVRTQVINGESKSHRATTSVLISSAQPNYFSQVVAALALALGPLAAGLGKGYSSPAIASLQEKQQFAIHTGNFTNTLTINSQQASWVASLSLLGALFGGMFGGIAMKFGRRKVLLITSIPFSASWLVTVFAKNVEMMFATGFVGGFCCAIVLLVSQVYISEIAVPDIRGCLSAVLKIFAHVGVLISFAVGAYLDWRELAMVIGCAPLVLFISVAYMPETPSYLVLVGKEQEAARSLQWFRGPHADVGKELLTIRNNVLAAHSDRFQNPNRHALITILNPILITCGLMVFQRFSGANAFNFYAVSIFRQTFGGMDPHSAAVAVAFVQLLSSLLSGLLIDTVGRLPLLIASSVFMSMALAGFGSFAYYEHVHRGRGYAVAQYDWIPLLCVLVFTIAFSMGISPISWLLIGELFPLEYRGLGSALATSFSYACAFIGVKTFVDFQEMFGLHGAFWFYSAVSIGGLCFIVCFVPETKGKDLSEMNCRSNRNIN